MKEQPSVAHRQMNRADRMPVTSTFDDSRAATNVQGWAAALGDTLYSMHAPGLSITGANFENLESSAHKAAMLISSTCTSFPGAAALLLRVCGSSHGNQDGQLLYCRRTFLTPSGAARSSLYASDRNVLSMGAWVDERVLTCEAPSRCRRS